MALINACLGDVISQRYAARLNGKHHALGAKSCFSAKNKEIAGILRRESCLIWQVNGCENVQTLRKWLAAFQVHGFRFEIQPSRITLNRAFSQYTDAKT